MCWLMLTHPHRVLPALSFASSRCLSAISRLRVTPLRDLRPAVMETAAREAAATPRARHGMTGRQAICVHFIP